MSSVFKFQILNVKSTKQTHTVHVPTLGSYLLYWSSPRPVKYHQYKHQSLISTLTKLYLHHLTLQHMTCVMKNLTNEQSVTEKNSASPSGATRHPSAEVWSCTVPTAAVLKWRLSLWFLHRVSEENTASILKVNDSVKVDVKWCSGRKHVSLRESVQSQPLKGCIGTYCLYLQWLNWFWQMLSDGVEEMYVYQLHQKTEEIWLFTSATLSLQHLPDQIQSTCRHRQCITLKC
jgi:hypothetical protein